jgi:hypothetical protein
MGWRHIITIMLALVSMTVSAIDEYQFHSGTAVLKGRILKKPADEWNLVSVRQVNSDTDVHTQHADAVGVAVGGDDMKYRLLKQK